MWNILPIGIHVSIVHAVEAKDVKQFGQTGKVVAIGLNVLVTVRTIEMVTHLSCVNGRTKLCIEPHGIIHHHTCHEIFMFPKEPVLSMISCQGSTCAQIGVVLTELEVLNVTVNVGEPSHHILHIHDTHRADIVKAGPATALLLQHVGQHVGLVDSIIIDEPAFIPLGHSHEAIAEHVAVNGVDERSSLIVIIVLWQRRILVEWLNAFA